MFLRDNRRRYPEASDEVTHDNMKSDKEIRIVSTASNAAQCKYVPTLLGELRPKDAQGGPIALDKRTAIVLTDENLLMPLLCSLSDPERECPDERVNVTMGFPLKHSTAYTFVERLIELQAHGRNSRDGYAFYHADVSGILAHPYLNGADNPAIGALQREIREDRLIRCRSACWGGTTCFGRFSPPLRTGNPSPPT